MNLKLFALFLSSPILLNNTYANSNYEARGCLKNSNNSYVCPTEGCTTRISTGATDKIELVCNPMKVFLNTNIYDESGPFRYIYDKTKYDELVKTNRAKLSSQANPDFSIHANVSGTKDKYNQEAYSSEAYTNKLTEIAAIFWTFQEFQKQCTPADEKKNILQNWFGTMERMKNSYINVAQRFKKAQELIASNARLSSNPQVAAIETQINSLLLYQNYLKETYGLANYNSIIQDLSRSTANDYINAQSQEHDLKRNYISMLGSDTFEPAIKMTEDACAKNINNCNAAREILLKVRYNEFGAKYPSVYYQKAAASEFLNRSLYNLEDDALNTLLSLPNPTPQYDWKREPIVRMQMFVDARKSFGLICPTTPSQSNMESAKAFLSQVNIEASEKNLEVMRVLFTEIDGVIGLPSQRIYLFDVIRQYSLQVAAWNNKTHAELEQNIKRLEELKKTTRKAVGLSESETESEARLKLSPYLANSPDLIGLKQYPSGIWFAEIRNADGKTTPVKLSYSGSGSEKNLCYGIIAEGCN